MWKPTLLALLGLSLCAAAASRAHAEAPIVQGCVSASLASSLAEAGVPPAVIAEASRALRRKLDADRDPSTVRRFAVRYKSGETPRLADLALKLEGGREIALHRSRSRLWFDDGESAEPPRLAKPLADAQVSSPFGRRNDTVYGPIKNIGPLGSKMPRVVKAHPLLTSTWSFHSGVDFAAHAGTPVLAAGDGIVRQVGRDSALGVAITIEHGDRLATRYGHLAGAADGIAPDVHVTQGQVIGFVGNTGVSSGPHLHYELLVNGGVVNPIGHPATSPDRLGKPDLARLHAAKIEIIGACP